MDYTITLELFEGPLDLLLNLISKTKIDIYDIPIYDITTQYMEYIYNLEILDLEIASDFLVMASTLLEIKSKMLLPKEKVIFEGEEFELDPREELVRQILEYKKFKEASDKLKEYENQKSKTYYKPKEDLSYYEDETIDFDSFNLDLLVKSLNNILFKRGIIGDEIEIHKIVKEEYSVSECMNRILNKLKVLNNFNFEDLLEKNSKKNEIIAYFLSLLELIKNKTIVVKQNNTFAELIIERPMIEEI